MHMAYKHQVKGFVKYVTPSEILIEAEGMEEHLESFIKCFCSDALLPTSCTIKVIDTKVKGYKSFELFASMDQSSGLTFKSNVQMPLLSFLKRYFSGPQTELMIIGLFTFF